MTFDPSTFADRRDDFSGLLRGGIAVLPASTEVVRNFDVHHEFRQDSDFWFLTGFDEPDAVAVIDPSHPEERFVLFVRPRDRELEIWNGYRAGVEGAIETFGADAAYPIAELDQELIRRFVGRSAVYTPLGNASFAGRVTRLVNRVRGVGTRYGRPVPVEMRDAAPLLHDLRLRKTSGESQIFDYFVRYGSTAQQSILSWVIVRLSGILHRNLPYIIQRRSISLDDNLGSGFIDRL